MSVVLSTIYNAVLTWYNFDIKADGMGKKALQIMIYSSAAAEKAEVPV